MYYPKTGNNSQKTIQLIVWTLLFFSVTILSFVAHNLSVIH